MQTMRSIFRRSTVLINYLDLFVVEFKLLAYGVVESESPLSSFYRQPTTTTVNSDIPTSQSTSSKTACAVSSIRFSQQQQQRPQTPHRHSLPLERYTKKQNQELATINEEIHFNQSELKEFDSKLRQAQNKMMDLYRLTEIAT